MPPEGKHSISRKKKRSYKHVTQLLFVVAATHRKIKSGREHRYASDTYDTLYESLGAETEETA